MTEYPTLTTKERQTLLGIARDSIIAVVNNEDLPVLVSYDYPDTLRREGVSFVTLTMYGQLRGCIGALEAYQPLYLDVQEHAVAAATQDYRFPPVRAEEVAKLIIEISCLTPTQRMEYSDEQDLIQKLRPGIDGVLIRDGIHRATFLPQVWEKVPDPQDFLTHLCLKMGAAGNLWRSNKLKVFTYQVEEFKEELTNNGR